MLQSIRDRLTGPIVWFVIGLIAIPFAFWGIDSFRSGGADPVVAKVGDQKITQAQYRQGYDQRYQQYRALLGENFRADLFDQKQFRRAILDDMVQESALRQFARDSGYRAGDNTLREYLTAIPAFQKDGKFSAETYKQLLERQALKPDRYETQVRESLVIEQLRESVQSSTFVTQSDLQDAIRLGNQKRKVVVVPVDAGQFRAQVKVTDEQIASRYEADKGRYMSPERVKLAYVEIDRTKLAPVDAPTAEALKAIYYQEKDARFSTPEERKASHILVGFGSDKSDAKKKAEGLVQQIESGADFSKLASENSEDSGSKSKGGDLGWIKKGMMVPAFEQAVFGAESGAIVGPVETEFGWHVIRLDEVKAAAVTPFEQADVQAALADVFRSREADRKFQELSAKLEQLAFEKTSLEPVAQELGLTVQTSEWFSRSGGPGIAAVEVVKNAAFSPEVLTNGENSKPLVSGPDSVVVIHKAEYEAARQKPLEEVRELVKEAVVADAALARAKEVAAALLADVKAGTGLTEAATSRNLAVQFDGEASRRQAELDATVVDEVFRMPRPEAGAVQARVVESPKSPVVVALISVLDPGTSAAGDSAMKEERGKQAEILASSEFNAYRRSVEDAVKVKIVNSPVDEPAAESPEL